MQSYPHALIFAAITLLVTGWVYASTLEWRGERLAQQIAAKEVPAGQFTRIPLTAGPSRTAAQTLLATRSNGHARIKALLEHSLAQRPLYAPYWLDRAEAAHRAGEPRAAENYLSTATTLWPNRPVLLWKSAMLRTRMGHTNDAIRTLREYLRAQPNSERQVLAVAMRLQPDPAALLPALLPDQIDDVHQTRDDLVWQILRIARAEDNAALGTAAWREFSGDAQRNRENAAYYTEWMAAFGNQGEAVSAWRRYRPGPGPLGLENGGFEERLQGGLGWRTWERAGVALERDTGSVFEGRHSLKASFSGNENIHYAHLRQYLPVRPQTRYTLRFAWRGKDISTRSGPFIDIRGKETGHIAHTEDRWGTWNWERRELTFTTPANETFVEVRLRRNRTDALDNRIGGTLWLDDFQLTQTATEAHSG